VTVERVTLRSADAAEPVATCLTVGNSNPLPGKVTPEGSVTVRDCEMTVGDKQIGLLVTNVARAQVEANTLHVEGRFRIDDRDLANLRSSLEKAAPKPLTPQVQKAIDAVEWRTLSHLGPKSGRVGYRGQGIELRSYLSIMAGYPDFIEKGIASAMAAWYKRLRNKKICAAQGILVAGMVAEEVRVLNNTLRGFIQGIHVGLSHDDQTPGVYDRAGRVQISGNTIEAAMPTKSGGRVPRDCHGIFVGNCSSLIIEGNLGTVNWLGAPYQSVRFDGIRIHGLLGPLMIVRHNHLEDFYTGIRIKSVPPEPSPVAQWLVADNVMTGAKYPVQVELPAGSKLQVRVSGNCP